jgi:hypothetical protein
MHRRPVLFRWVVLAARWWNKLAGADSSVPRLARSAWHADIALMRGHTTGTVCTDCWAYRLLAALEAIGALPRGWLGSIDLYALRFDEGVVRQRLDACLNALLGAVPAVCPRAAPSAEVAVATHVHWVRLRPAGVTGSGGLRPRTCVCACPCRWYRPSLGCGWAGPGWRCAWVGSGAQPCPAPSGYVVCALLPGARQRCIRPCSCAPRRAGVGRAWKIRCISCLSARHMMRCAARLGCCQRSHGPRPTARRVCVTCLHTRRRCSLRAWCMPCVLVARNY